MPITLRRVKINDLLQMQQTNLHCLPENYHLWYWLYHYIIAPQAAHVAVDSRGKLLGYVLGKTDDEGRNKKPPEPIHGHITSVAVYNGFRKLGIATKLLQYTHKTLKECFKTEYVSLNVRETNRAGRLLYEKTLGYKFDHLEERYYADQENGLLLKYFYDKEVQK